MRSGTKAGADGFTLIEALVYLVMGGLVVGVIHYSVLRHQRDLTEQRATSAVQSSLRNAAMLLVGELRGLSPEGGDLRRLGTTEVDIRSVRGAGVVCGILSGQPVPTYTLAFSTGDFQAQPQDSALVLAVNGRGLADDDWRAVAVTMVTAPSGNAKKAYECDWPTNKPVEAHLRIGVSGDTSGVKLGSVVRPFRPLSYGLFEVDGAWWLGRREPAMGWERLAGPLLAPADSGMVLRYLGRLGNVVTSPTAVAAIEILLQAARPGFSQRVDSLRTVVALRG